MQHARRVATALTDALQTTLEDDRTLSSSHEVRAARVTRARCTSSLPSSAQRESERWARASCEAEQRSGRTSERDDRGGILDNPSLRARAREFSGARHTVRTAADSDGVRDRFRSI